MRRRLFVALLLLAALAGGLWWSFSDGPLNDTEVRLVGAWEHDIGSRSPPTVAVEFLLADRRRFRFVRTINGSYAPAKVYDMRWRAIQNTVTFQYDGSFPINSIQEWVERTLAHLKGGDFYEFEIVQLTDTAIEMNSPPRSGDPSEIWHRSQDPELLAMFEKLSAGESP